MLPYTIEVYFAVMADYNRAWFPAAPLGVAGACLALLLATAPAAARTRFAARIIGALLAAAWIWVGTVHQLVHMAPINFLAPVYGWVWIFGGVLIAWPALVRGRMGFAFTGDKCAWAGLALALYALAVHPLLVHAHGQNWRALEFVGTAADPSAIFTVGFLLMTRGRAPLYLFAIPVGWAGVAAVTAWTLGFAPGAAVPIAVGMAATLALTQGRTRAG